MARVAFQVSAGLLCACLGYASAGAQSFHEEFEGQALDPAVWTVDLGDGQITVADGVATLTCAGSSFPVATSVNDPFPPGDFVVRVRLRYTSVVRCGDGFGSLDNFWENYYGTACRPFLLWQDAFGWYSYTGNSAYHYIGSGPDTAYHVYEWTYVDGRYTFFLDGVSLSTGTCAPRATRVFFGHPHPIGCSPWTSFEIDYIHIEAYGATETTRPAWGGVKALYR
jgi:hypothetical protein